MKAFQIQAILDNYNIRKDNSLSLRFVTNEVSYEDLEPIHKSKDMFGTLIFRPEMASEDTEVIDVDLEPKSKAQRLRGVLYRYLEHKLGREPKDDEFSDFYHKQMTAIINKYKDLLP